MPSAAAVCAGVGSREGPGMLERLRPNATTCVFEDEDDDDDGTPGGAVSWCVCSSAPVLVVGVLSYLKKVSKDECLGGAALSASLL